MIVVRSHELASPQLFGMSGISSASPFGLDFAAGAKKLVYLLDMNVLFDLGPRRQVQGNGAGGHWNEFGLMADYLLSRRTDVYAQALCVRASQDAVAQVYGSAGTSDSSHRTVARVGLRRKVRDCRTSRCIRCHDRIAVGMANTTRPAVSQTNFVEGHWAARHSARSRC